MLTMLSIVAAFLLILLGLLLAWSYPGKPKPFMDQNGNTLPGSISEKILVEVNGARQGMFIKSRDVSNPVRLYLHGGMLITSSRRNILRASMTTLRSYGGNSAGQAFRTARKSHPRR